MSALVNAALQSAANDVLRHHHAKKLASVLGSTSLCVWRPTVAANEDRALSSPGTGTGPHIAGELFKMMAGVDMVHVPYRGAGPSLTDLIGARSLTRVT